MAVLMVRGGRGRPGRLDAAVPMPAPG